VDFSLQANHINWATATGRRILVPTFVDRGVSRNQRGGFPMVVNVSFPDRGRYFLSISSLFILTRLSEPHSIPTPSSVALSPWANYTDWAAATCQRNLLPTFVDRGVSHVQRGESPTVVNLSYLDRISYPLILRKCGSAKNRTWDLWVCSQEFWPLDHRGNPAQAHTCM
jgi:hypothetical protein